MKRKIAYIRRSQAIGMIALAFLAGVLFTGAIAVILYSYASVTLSFSEEESPGTGQSLCGDDGQAYYLIYPAQPVNPECETDMNFFKRR